MGKVLNEMGAERELSIKHAAENGQEIKIALDWKKSSFFKRVFGGGAIDLDLGCFYELTDGRRCLIDRLQTAWKNGGPRDQQTPQGCYTDLPYIWHGGDDDGSGRHSQESLIVNPQGANTIKRMIVYAYICGGAADWADVSTQLTVSVPGCDDMVVKLERIPTDRRFCAIAELEFAPENITMRTLLTLHNGHADCDSEYDWGFKYHEV